MFEVIDGNRGLYMPTRNRAGDAGWDLSYSPEGIEDTSVVLAPGDRRLLGTNLRLAGGAIDGNVGLVFGRSGLANKHGVTLANSVGVVDSGYRGELLINLVNLGKESVEILAGDRIAQMVVVAVADWSGVGVVRGDGGHGSSGR